MEEAVREEILKNRKAQGCDSVFLLAPCLFCRGSLPHSWGKSQCEGHPSWFARAQIDPEAEMYQEVSVRGREGAEKQLARARGCIQATATPKFLCCS